MRSLTRLLAIAAATLTLAAGAVVAAAPASAIPTYAIGFSSGDFGSVTEGTTKQLTVTLTNDGSAPITVDSATDLTTLPAPFAFVSATITTTDVLKPGDTADVKFSFTAGAPDVGSSTKITFRAQSTTAPGFFEPYVLTLSGKSAAKGSFEVTEPANGDDLDFGSVEVGSTGKKVITVRNDSTVALDFDSAALTARDVKGNAVPVSFMGTPFTTTLAPGASMTFTLAFSPTAEGRLDGFITLVGTAGTESITRVVEFTALGISAVVPTPTPTPTTPAGAGTGTAGTGTSAGTAGRPGGTTTGTSGRTLASTGADSAGVFAGASVALMLLVGGGVALVQRRRRAKA